MKLKGSLSQAGQSVVLNDGATTQATVTTSNAATATYTLPAATDTLVGRASTDVFTNKSIDAATNTLTNIANSAISSSAAIAYSKLALTGAVVNADISASAAIAYSKLALTGSIVNADISASAAVAYSKLALTGSIVNADVSGSAAIAYGKLALTGSVVNADISASAAIALTKLAALSNSIVPVTNGSGVITSSAVTATELGYLSGVTSAIQTQLGTKQATITGAATTIASLDLTASRALVANASGKVAVSTVTDTELGYVSGVTSAIQTQINTGGTNLTAHTGASTGVHGVTGAVVGTTDTQTLSAKTLASPAMTGAMTITTGTAPSTPAASKVALYAKSDNRLYLLDSGGTESPAGAGLTPTYKAANFTAAPGNNYLVNTTGGNITATLPAGSSFATISFTDDKGTWGGTATRLTITPSTGQQIRGLAVDESLVCDVAGAWVELNWDATNSQWIYATNGYASAVGPTTSATTTASGLVDTTTQSFAGNKTFTGRVTAGNSKVRVYLNAATSLSTGTTTRVQFDTAEFDTNSEMDITSSKGVFTAKSPGYYLIAACVSFAAGASGIELEAQIRKNGSVVGAGDVGSASANSYNVAVSTVVFLNGTTDNVDVAAWQNSGTSKSLNVGSTSATNVTIVQLI